MNVFMVNGDLIDIMYIVCTSWLGRKNIPRKTWIWYNPKYINEIIEKKDHHAVMRLKIYYQFDKSCRSVHLASLLASNLKHYDFYTL